MRILTWWSQHMKLKVVKEVVIYSNIYLLYLLRAWCDSPRMGHVVGIQKVLKWGGKLWKGGRIAYHMWLSYYFLIVVVKIKPLISKINCFIYVNESPLKVMKIRKGSGNSFSTTFCVWFFKKKFSHILLTDQIYLSDCLFFLRYWTICVLQWFLSQVVTS